jgi:mannose-6-phosphate isomerase-like protein (cupin superfamily)
MIEEIVHEGGMLALIVRAGFRADGIRFFTPDSFSQQLGYMNRPQGYAIPPHVHNPVTRSVQYTKEVLFIRSGRVRVDFYDEAQRYLESRILESGDVILLANGGHGFEMLEPTEMIEVKQGPYAGEADKTRFVGIDRATVKLGKP